MAYALIEKEARPHLMPGTVSVKGMFIGLEAGKWVIAAEGRRWVTNHCKFYEQHMIGRGMPALLQMCSSTQTDSPPEVEAVLSTDMSEDSITEAIAAVSKGDESLAQRRMLIEACVHRPRGLNKTMIAEVQAAVQLMCKTTGWPTDVLPARPAQFKRDLGPHVLRKRPGRVAAVTTPSIDMKQAWAGLGCDESSMHSIGNQVVQERVMMCIGGVPMPVENICEDLDEEGEWTSLDIDMEEVRVTDGKPDEGEWMVAQSGGRVCVAVSRSPMLTLVGPQGEYQMSNPATVKQARKTPEWLLWKTAIEEHINKVEREGAVPTPLSAAVAHLQEHGLNEGHIMDSLMRLRVKTTAGRELIKLQARGCLNGADWDHAAYDMATTSRNLPPEGARLLAAEAAVEDRMIIVGDVPNAYNQSEWDEATTAADTTSEDEKKPALPVYMRMFEGFEQMSADGEPMVYLMTKPHYGAPPSGKCLENQVDNMLVTKCGARKSLVIDGMYHVSIEDRVLRVGRIVDDFLITVSRTKPMEDFKRMKLSLEDMFGPIEWNIDPACFDFGGVRYYRSRVHKTISMSVAGKIEACIAKHHPELVGSTSAVEQVGSKEKLDLLVLPPAEERASKLSKTQKACQEEIGLWMWIVEWFLPIQRVVHALTCVMAYPPDVTHAVLKAMAAYAYANREICNTFGGPSARAEEKPTARVKLCPLDEPETMPGEAVVCDATWTGDETKSLKATAIKWMGGTITAKVATIRAIMPSSFTAETEALYEATEVGDYIGDALTEMGQIPPNSTLVLQDNEGLVKTVQEKAKGGSKFHRRKIGLILERLSTRRYQVVHISDTQQPVDFMTKLVSKAKLRKSIYYLYNMAHAPRPAMGK
jgi:hypothetical protein